MKTLVLVFTLAAVLVRGTQSLIDDDLRAMGPEPDVSSVWTGPVVRALSLGFSDFLADLYWLRAVQYYGRQKVEGAPESYVNLLPLLETAAEVDPRFEIVYRYGAVFLSEPHPVGAGTPEIGVGLLEKGADRNPLNWRLRQEQGLFTFFYLNDAARGARILTRAAAIPDAPFWMKNLAAQVLTSGGELEAAVRMWSIIYEQSQPGVLRDNAAAQIMVARDRILARDLQKAVRAYQERTGDHASSLQQLAAAGVVSTYRDLAGIPFDFHPADGIVRVPKVSPHWRR